MKKNISVFYVTIFLLILGSYDLGQAGAWAQKKGKIYLRIAGMYLQTSKEFDYSGRRVDNFGYTFEKSPNSIRDPLFRDFSLFGYVEYGLTDKMTAVADLGFKSLTSRRTELYGAAQGGGETFFETITSGFSDLRVSLRYQFLAWPVVLSLQAGAKFPLGYKKPPETGEIVMFENSDEQNRAPLGTGRVDGEIQLLLGRSLYPLPLYFTGGVGYRQRGGMTFHDELIYSAEVGVTINEVLFKVYLDGIHSTNRPLPDKNAISISTPLEGGAWVNFNVGDQDLVKISPSIIYPVSRNLYIQAELIHFLSGKNTIGGDILSAGFVFKK